MSQGSHLFDSVGLCSFFWELFKYLVMFSIWSTGLMRAIHGHFFPMLTHELWDILPAEMEGTFADRSGIYTSLYSTLEMHHCPWFSLLGLQLSSFILLSPPLTCRILKFTILAKDWIFLQDLSIMVSLLLYINKWWENNKVSYNQCWSLWLFLALK